MQVTIETSTTKPTQSGTPAEAQPAPKTTIATQDKFVSSAKGQSGGSPSLLSRVGGAITGGLKTAGDAVANAFDAATSGLKSLLDSITRSWIALGAANFKAAQQQEQDRIDEAKKDDQAVEAAAEASRAAAAQAASANKH